MLEPNKGGSLGSIIMLLTLLIGGVALESQVNLTGSRPIKKNVIQQHHFDEENIDARLWQDPFEAVYQAISMKNSKIEGKLPDINSRESAQITILGVLVSTGPYFVDAENRRRTRYAVLSGLAASGFQPENPEYIGYMKGYEKSEDVPHHPVPEILPYEWFTGNRKYPHGESRAESVLVLWLDDHHFSHKHGGGKNFTENIKELFKWVSDQTNKITQISLIGPTGSTDLMEMVKGVKVPVGNDSGDPVRLLEIYSTRATKDEALILKLAPPPPPKKIKSEAENSSDSVEPSSSSDEGETPAKSKSIHQLFEDRKTNIRFLRTTPTDYHLAKVLVRELKLRGIERDSDIALISEWDTDYGRAFKETMCKAWKVYRWEEDKFDEAKAIIKKDESFCDEFKNIRYFSYLRGLDGEMTESSNATPKNPKNSRTLASKEEFVDFSNLRAEKERQYDYLLRLAGRIEVAERNLKGKGEWTEPFKTRHFEAFGILGSDYYDKLVVLQALRRKFEHVQFFTTDMDARFFHHEDFKHVRNLLVGSGFGLSLQKKLQMHIPPLRDTYQTSAYLATLIAFESKTCKKSLTQDKLDEWLQARVFEIGRTQAFDLSLNHDLNWFGCFKKFDSDKDMALSLHPDSASEVPPYKYPAVGFLMLALVFLVCLKFKEYWKWVLTGMLILAGFMILTLSLNTQWDEEPLAFFEGVSIWPTDFLRLLGVLAAVAVIGLYNGNPFSSTSKGKLQSNWDRINEDFKYSEIQVTDKWKPYGKKVLWKMVGWRAAVFIGLGLLILTTFGFPFIPFRGSISKWVDIFILALFIISFAISLYYSGTHLNDSITLLKSFKNRNLKWPDAVKKKFFSEAIPGAAGSDPSKLPELPSSMKAMLDGPISLRFIAQRTDVVDELIYFPLGILAIGLVSRARVFDNWEFPLSLGVLFIYGAIYVLWKALQVQREAEKRKMKLMDQLETQRIHFNALGQEKEEGFLKLLIENTQSFKKGAFMPLGEHAFYKALLLPFSGFGGMALLEYLFLAV